MNNQPTSLFQKYRKELMLAGALIVFFVFSCYFALQIYGYKSDMPVKGIAFGYLAVAVVFCAFLAGCYLVLSKKEIATEKIFLFFMLTAGVIYALCFLPFTIPDEGEHYLSVYRLSNFFTFTKGQAGNKELIIRNVDYELVTGLRQNKLTPEYFSSLLQNFRMFADTGETTVMTAKFIESAPHGYIAAAIGVSLGRVLNLGAIPTFYLGRFANLTIYTFAVYWAIKRIPYGKTAVFVISASPILIHLFASYSYDYIIIALSIMFVAQVIHMREKEGSVTIKDLIICVLLAILLAPAKIVYFPILLAIFIVPNEKFGFSKKTAILIKLGIVGVGITALLIMQLGKISTYMGDGNTVSWSEAEVYSLSRAFRYPIEFIRMVANTAFGYTDYYASMMVGNHMDGTGAVTIPIFLWMPMLAVTFFSFLRRKDENKGVLSDWTRFFLFAVAAAVVAMSVISIMFSWTPITLNHIKGVQGRYFIPVLPLLFLAMRGRRILRPANSDKYIIYFCIYYNMLMPLVYFGSLFLPSFT